MAPLIDWGILQDIIRFSRVQKTFYRKTAYLFKGLLFVPFLSRAVRKAAVDDTVSTMSQAGDDIYPLF
jgi:hypothetical protein